MHRYSLSVETRLRIVRIYLDTLKLPAKTTGQHPSIPQLSTSAALASWLAHMSDAADSHVAAIQLALPANCRSLDAPFLWRRL
jgi:hypothetical protein